MTTSLDALPDSSVRWRKGERLDHLFEDVCDRLESEGRGEHPAVVTSTELVSFTELDRRANQLAHHLVARGVRSGDRLGVLLDRCLESYVALLAVLKADAAYVPLDPGFPPARIDYIVRDAEVSSVLTLSRLSQVLDDVAVSHLCLDLEQEAIDERPATRRNPGERLPQDLCYVVYTSGSTGNPKGVAIEHSSICNFVRVAAEVYGYTESDRVYQGMTIAFDFSVEELWVPLIAGATLVPAGAGATLVGPDLSDFLIENRVTALCCVPTLLATMDAEMPDLRFILVSGEACPQDLVTRWSRDGRTLLNGDLDQPASRQARHHRASASHLLRRHSRRERLRRAGPRPDGRDRHCRHRARTGLSQPGRPHHDELRPR
jgi:non-ribosomal peptide synthetase component F